VLVEASGGAGSTVVFEFGDASTRTMGKYAMYF
jgi:hypothetical protein